MRINKHPFIPTGLYFTDNDGGAGGDGPQNDSGQGKGSQQGGNSWTAPASQEDFDRIIEQRLSRERAKYADYDQLKTKAEQLEAASATDQQRAAETARKEAAAEAQKAAVPRVVKAEFKAAAKGVLTAEQLTALLEDRDLSKYADADGDPDEAKIAALVKQFAPAKDDKEFPDLGGGNRGGNAKTTDMNALIRQQAGRT